VPRDAQVDENHTITLARDFAELVPPFLENRRNEVAALRAALEQSRYEDLQQLGHRMRGLGASYGFELVSTLGGRIEEGAEARDREALAAAIAEYAGHLERVKVVYE
jgi:hypothetical protein